MYTSQPEDRFSCSDLPLVEAHPAGQIVLQFTTGRAEQESEPVTSLSAVLPQALTNHHLNKMDQEPVLWLCSSEQGNCRMIHMRLQRKACLKYKFKGSQHLQL